MPDQPSSFDNRFLRLGGTPIERGRALGTRLGSSVRQLLALRSSDKNSFSRQCGPALERYAPVCYQELLGLADSLSVPVQDVFSLAAEYEDWMCRRPTAASKCSGFVHRGGNVLAGQTNDEDPDDWFDATLDVVLQYEDHECGGTLIYTHPGIPAYMGINDRGLCVLWQYIDNAERNPRGLPTTALLREALTCSCVDEAIEYLRSVPRAVPNNFLFCDRETAANVECSPTRLTEKRVDEGHFCHTNHVLLDEDMARHDVGLNDPRSTSRERLRTLEQMIGTRELSVNSALQSLSTPPVNYERTLAAMLFLPMENSMHIFFKGDPCGCFRVYALDSPQPATA